MQDVQQGVLLMYCGVLTMDEFWDQIVWVFRRLGECSLWKLLAGAILTAAQFLCGDMRPALSAILVLAGMDFLTGFAYAVMKREVSSSRLLRGGLKLAIYGNLLVLGHQFAVSELVGIGVAVSGLIDGYLMLTEAVSVVENLDRIACHNGIDLPFLRVLLRHLRQHTDKLGR